jgi:phosphate starvation-inducible PhoH-like protein
MENQTAAPSVDFSVEDVAVARALFGERQANLKALERALGIRADSRGGEVHLRGPKEAVDIALDTLRALERLVRQGHALFPSDVDHASRIVRDAGAGKLAEILSDTIHVGVKNRRVTPKSLTQKVYVDAIRSYDIVFGIGPAGTGKTYLAMAMAIAALLKNEVNRIVLARPAVEAGEKLGFLPGDIAEKVNPYLRPLYDALHDMLDFDRAAKLIELGTIEVAPLAFMRGRTLNDSYVILDEAQNTTREQMKMFLTRLGIGSKAVITGDVTQVDLPTGKGSGLVDAQRVLANLEEIRFVHFTDHDVVRHRLVQEIVRAYDRGTADAS